jgi:hypothetical protein
MSGQGIRRRLFLGGAFGTLALKPPRTAQADTPFKSFSFAATGAPTARTMPDRLSDVINVKDWGALGRGGNYRAQIQAAINYAIGPRADGTTGGTVFFPAGMYNLDAPLVIGSDTEDVGIRLIGSGKGGTTYIGETTPGAVTSSGYAFSKGNKLYDCIELMQGFHCLPIKITRPNAAIIECRAGPVDASESIGCLIMELENNGGPHLTADSPDFGEFRNSMATGPGLTITTGVAKSCRFGGAWEIGFALSGHGSVCIGCSVEVSGCAVRVGWQPASTHAATASGAVVTFTTMPHISKLIIGRAVSGTNIPAGTRIAAVGTNTITLSAAVTGAITSIRLDEDCPAYGATVQGLQTEACKVGIDLWNVNGGFVSNCFISQAETTAYSPIANITWLAGTATATTSTAHNMGSTGVNYIHLAAVGNSTFQPPNGGATTATVTSPTTFTYPLVTNPGTTFNTGSPASWNWAQISGLRSRIVHNTMIIGMGMNNTCAVATMELDMTGNGHDGYPESAKIAHTNNYVACMGNRAATSDHFSVTSWKVPVNHVKNLAGWKFGPLYGDTGPWGNGLTSPFGTMVFADLPGQAGVLQPGPHEGMEYDIIDGSPGSAAFDATITGGGSGKYRVRWNGSAWKRIG